MCAPAFAPHLPDLANERLRATTVTPVDHLPNLRMLDRRMFSGGRGRFNRRRWRCCCAAGNALGHRDEEFDVARNVRGAESVRCGVVLKQRGGHVRASKCAAGVQRLPQRLDLAIERALADRCRRVSMGYCPATFQHYPSGPPRSTSAVEPCGLDLTALGGGFLERREAPPERDLSYRFVRRRTRCRVVDRRDGSSQQPKSEAIVARSGGRVGRATAVAADHTSLTCAAVGCEPYSRTAWSQIPRGNLRQATGTPSSLDSVTRVSLGEAGVSDLGPVVSLSMTRAAPSSRYAVRSPSSSSAAQYADHDRYPSAAGRAHAPTGATRHARPLAPAGSSRVPTRGPRAPTSALAPLDHGPTARASSPYARRATAPSSPSRRRASCMPRTPRARAPPCSTRPDSQ